jgi:hypothetical protein
MSNNREKPAVYIAVEDNYKNSSLLNYLGYGLEEEGIPFKMVNDSAQDLYSLAHQAAQASRLNVSLALGENNKVIIHHKKLEPDNPFFEKEISKEFQAKAIASNAARLVKGIPIKEIPLKLDHKNKSVSGILSDLDNVNSDNETLKNKQISNPEKQLDNKEIEEITDYIYQKLKNIAKSQ